MVIGAPAEPDALTVTWSQVFWMALSDQISSRRSLPPVPAPERTRRLAGAGAVAQFFFITLPHLRRAISVVVMIETIFLLTVFAEIYVTTSGGPGNATTNLAFLIYARALLQFDVAGGSAGGMVAIVLANIVAIFLVRTIARQLEV